MKERRRRRDVLSWSRLFWFTLFVVFSCVLITTFTFSPFRLLFGGTFHPVLVSTWRNPAMEAISDDTSTPLITVREVVTFPDQAVIFINSPPPVRMFAKENLNCAYFSNKSSDPQLVKSPIRIDSDDLEKQIVRCPLPQRGLTVSLTLKSNGFDHVLPAGPTHTWGFLVYEALIDRDNTTVVFAKGLNLRPEKVYNASRFECVYGWDFRRSKFFLKSDVLSIAQEIARCKTPLSVLSSPQRINSSIKVSIRVKGKVTLNSIAKPGGLVNLPIRKKQHEMCICTMLRNQARFLKEWVMYHTHIGVQRWFIYDNNSDDDISAIIESLISLNYKISQHVWPWIKTQEAGFAHCALRAREVCEWVGFIDVDEYFHLPSGLFIHNLLTRSSLSKYGGNVGELRVPCHSFGPSGLTQVPRQGVTIGYTCRLAATERHKSIVRPEALNSTLINVVHHFHLKDGFEFLNLEKGDMVINHYKYQVWEVFKEKFYRRVATYVADWQNEENVRSRDRAPGLGTRAVQPPDWPSRFCEVRDFGLKKRVLKTLADSKTDLLPWQQHEHDHLHYKVSRRRKHREFTRLEPTFL